MAQSRPPSHFFRLPLALSQGDPSGIGTELTLKAWLKIHDEPNAVPFVFIANPDHTAAVAKRLRLDVPIKAVTVEEAALVFPYALPVVALNHAVAGDLGTPDIRDASGTVASIKECVRLVHAGVASAVVTNPIAKEVFYRAGFRHPGHTEFLKELADRHYGGRARAIMLLWAPQFSVVPATIHVPLARVPMLLTRELLVATGSVVARDLALRFGKKNPRLAFTSLNPHAGEGGTMGREEIEVISPALADLKAAGIAASGPFPADTIFRRGIRKTYEAVIAMYHDQALIPVKAVAFDRAVNVTLGLPLIRTSPDHGTAFDIAARGIADPSSLISALKLAGKMARRSRIV
ncbi:MAG TPA: 4-hydroxythreonine-4-phosphate dehydrogenase PdxA [Methylocella sp.]|nr:4-hydroxythreonine-4-phosphate dehydrogenase PdxA [Methylocella sp.]